MATPALPAFSAVIDDATVVRVDPSLGVLLALPVAFGSSHDDAHKRKKRRTAADTADGARDDDAAAAKEPEMPPLRRPVHVSRVLDGSARVERDALAKQFPEGARVRCRVVARGASLEGWLAASVAPATLEATVLRVADVRPADVLQASVLKLEPAGAEVSLGENVRGFIAHQHLGDTAKHAASKALLAKRAAQFKVGARVACRALVVDTVRNRVVLTAKQALVRDQEPPRELRRRPRRARRRRAAARCTPRAS